MYNLSLTSTAVLLLLRASNIVGMSDFLWSCTSLGSWSNTAYGLCFKSMCLSEFFTHNFELVSLTLKAPIMTAADDIHKYFFIVFQNVSSESSARQRIHVKNQALFSWEDKSKKLKCRLLQFLSGALRVKFHDNRFSFTNRRSPNPVCPIHLDTLP